MRCNGRLILSLLKIFEKFFFQAFPNFNQATFTCKHISWCGYAVTTLRKKFTKTFRYVNLLNRLYVLCVLLLICSHSRNKFCNLLQLLRCQRRSKKFISLIIFDYSTSIPSINCVYAFVHIFWC